MYILPINCESTLCFIKSTQLVTSLKIDLIIKQDGGWLGLFVLQYFRNKHVVKNLTDITITLNALIDNQTCIAISL